MSEKTTEGVSKATSERGSVRDAGPAGNPNTGVTHLATLRPDGAQPGAQPGAQQAPLEAPSVTEPRPTATPGPERAHDAVAPVESPGRPRADDFAYTLPPAAEPVVERIRARPGTMLTVAPNAAGPRLSVRVEVPEVWDVVRLDAAAAAPVGDVKRSALGLLLSGTAAPEEYVVKLNGATVLDEGASIAAAGARDGSIFLVTHRRRRPVR